MSIEPVNSAMRLAVSDILSKFTRDDGWSGYAQNEVLTELSQQVLETYVPYHVDSGTLREELNRKDIVKMRDQHRFLYLERIEDKNILPLVTLQTSSDWTNFRVYALLTTLDENSTLQSIAIRFETDEGGSQSGSGTGSHDFCHAQLCNYINQRIQDVAPSWVPDSQLAIPLDANSQISLVLCMLTALYGGRVVRRRLNDSGHRELSTHLNTVRALRDS